MYISHKKKTITFITYSKWYEVKVLRWWRQKRSFCFEVTKEVHETQFIFLKIHCCMPLTPLYASPEPNPPGPYLSWWSLMPVHLQEWTSGCQMQNNRLASRSVTQFSTLDISRETSKASTVSTVKKRKKRDSEWMWWKPLEGVGGLWGVVGQLGGWFKHWEVEGLECWGVGAVVHCLLRPFSPLFFL